MTFKTIPLEQMKINPSNDRHGTLGSETQAVEWLFENRKEEMKGLARDIAEEARVFDAPLVMQKGDMYIVFDGNRRTTCLKILTRLLDPPISVQNFFKTLIEKHSNDISTELECQVETSQETVDKILTRRHGGKLTGEGQIKWDTRAKSNHAERTGRTSTYALARKIEEYLRDKGYPQSNKIKLSNLDKILDTKSRKRRVGVELSDSGLLVFSKDETDARANLIKICDDIVSGELTLKQLLLTEDKNQYLADLAEKGFDTNLVKPELARKTVKKDGSRKNPSPRGVRRKTLIPKETDYNIEWSVGQQKVQTLWQQLQHLLEFEKHDISIAIVFRVLLEQITNSAFDRKSLKKPNNDTLQNRIVMVSECLANEGEYDQDQHKDIRRRIEDPKSLSSIGALQRILHARQETPAKSDMVALWDSLELFTLGALKK